ncbi:MAG: hypothetical protein KJ915_11275 [Candidatus Omnitrophica bacterium]|nr:hypothetical protein [Candidatus Omnitrophota bacterium]
MKPKNTHKIISIFLTILLIFVLKADALNINSSGHKGIGEYLFSLNNGVESTNFAMLSPNININDQLFVSMFMDMQKEFAEDISVLDDPMREHSMKKTEDEGFSYYHWLEQIREINEDRKKGIIKLPDLKWHPNFTPRALGLLKKLVEKEDIIAMALSVKGSLARGFFMPGSDTDGLRIYHNIETERIDSLDNELRVKLANLGLSFSIMPELDIDWKEGLPERPGVVFFKNNVWFLDEYGLDNPKQIARKKLFKEWDSLSDHEKGMLQFLHGLVCGQTVSKKETELYLFPGEKSVLSNLEQRGLVSLEENSIIVDWMNPPSNKLRIVYVLADKDRKTISLKKRVEYKHTDKIFEISI